MRYKPAKLCPQSFPVNVFNFASARGIVIIRRPLPDKISGILHKFPGRSYLYLNSNHCSERQRFTVAHELVHHVLDTAGTYLAHSGAMTFRERRANRYAAELLMPKSEVLRCLERNMSITNMLRHFNVSEEALRLRLSEVRKHNLKGTLEKRFLGL